MIQHGGRDRRRKKGVQVPHLGKGVLRYLLGFVEEKSV
jgi:hypothetical protein